MIVAIVPMSTRTKGSVMGTRGPFDKKVCGWWTQIWTTDPTRKDLEDVRKRRREIAMLEA